MRERVKRQVDQTQRPRYVSRFEHLALHPRLHHRVGFPIHYNVHRGLPPREPSPRRICYNYGVPNSSLNTSTSNEANNQQTTTSTEEVHNQSQSPHTWGIQTNHPITSTEEGYNKNKGVQLRGYNNNLKTLSLSFFFHKTKILIV